ncbi:MAG: hypothetical protein KatS3mg101_1060 [Patescibacteria group bacterium]|nr:MAG: hypothetical protein KatS3mg101_1060 [Patescibacteria group bacterium]
MGKIYKQICKECGTYYEGRGMYFCSVKCSGKNEDRIRKHAEAIRGRPSWNKGLKGWKSNDALKQWCLNGGKPWNKGLKGIHFSPDTEFKKNDPRITGKNNPNWKGGVSEENRKLRKRKEYIEWRNAVYARDGWACKICKKKLQAGNIVAHHIKSFSNHKDKRLDVDNGVTLCRSCHALIHNPKNKFIKDANESYFGQSVANFN